MIDLACPAQRLRAHGMTLSLRQPQPHIRQLIELVGLHRPRRSWSSCRSRPAGALARG